MHIYIHIYIYTYIYTYIYNHCSVGGSRILQLGSVLFARQVQGYFMDGWRIQQLVVPSNWMGGVLQRCKPKLGDLQ